MSNVTPASSTDSSRRNRTRCWVFGVPKRCWCGVNIKSYISKSDPNPYRRYYRCAFAADQKLINDTHVFKWVDEAFLNEINNLQRDVASVQNQLNGLTGFIPTETSLHDLVDSKLAEADKRYSKIAITTVLACVVLIVTSKVLF